MSIPTWLPILIALPFAIRLSWTDFKTHRLPNLLVGTMSVLLAACMLVTCFVQESWVNLWRALFAGCAGALVFLMLYLMSRGQLGMGDVKYSFPLGLVVGWSNSGSWLTAIWLTFILAGLFALCHRLALRARVPMQSKGRSREECSQNQPSLYKAVIPLGPFMSVASIACAALPLLR